MNDAERVAELEKVLAQFLQPVRNIPFPIVIKAMADSAVIPIDLSIPNDVQLVNALVSAASIVKRLVDATPIQRNRPNEVGNDIEPFVMQAFGQVGLKAERPRSARGRGKQTGYPDILVYQEDQRPSYVECKVFGEDAVFSTMRSFYLSPSDNFKVCLDARHLLLAFGVNREPIPASPDSLYRPTSFKLIDLHNLKCDVKYEFNSDNVRLYEDGMVLASGEL